MVLRAYNPHINKYTHRKLTSPSSATCKTSLAPAGTAHQNDIEWPTIGLLVSMSWAACTIGALGSTKDGIFVRQPVGMVNLLHQFWNNILFETGQQEGTWAFPFA